MQIPATPYPSVHKKGILRSARIRERSTKNRNIKWKQFEVEVPFFYSVYQAKSEDHE
jgi:hypothetical protein